MSKSVIAGTVALLVSFISPQATAKATWELGFIGGVNIAKLTGDTDSLVTGSVPGAGSISGNVNQTKPGLVLGGLAMVTISPTFGIRLEGLYSQQGGKGDISGVVNVSGQDVSFTGTATFKLDYIQIPVLAAFSFPTGPTTSIRALIGPSFGLAVNREMKLEITALGTSDSETFDAEDLLKSSDISGVIGAEVSVGLGATKSTKLLLDARYMIGFTNVAEDPSGTVSLKNGVLSLMVGFAFPVGVK